MLIKQDCICTPVDKNRPLHIYLPDDYDESDEQYPVMYFFDGHNLFRDEDATYGKSWGLETFMSQWDKPMIVVGFECGHEGDERLAEYSPYHLTGNYIGEVFGIGDSIFRWITEEVKPCIDGEFRTYYFREATGIGGSSMGGLMSLYGAARFNRFFSKAACLSPTIIPCVSELCRDIDESFIDPDTRVWLSYGEKEAFMGRRNVQGARENLTKLYTERIEDRLRAKRAAFETYVQPKGRHCEADWEKQIPMFMDYLWMH